MLFRGAWVNFTLVGKLLLTLAGLLSLFAQWAAALGLIPAAEFIFIAGLLIQLMVGISSFFELVQLERPLLRRQGNRMR